MKYFFLFAFLCVGARADWTDIASDEFTIPDPPRVGSEAYRKDFETLHRLQDSRPEAACKLARTQKAPTAEAFFENSGLLSALEFQKAEGKLKKAFRFTDRVTGYFKTKFHRKRPYDTDSGIVPCVEKPGGQKSYPSSHASIAAVGACVLSKLYPAKAKKVTEYAAYLGQLRVVVGVHHPSDVEAGQLLAKQICRYLP